MELFNTILVPTNFSETSTQAYHYALQWARQVGAVVHLVHVVGPPMMVAPFPDPAHTAMTVEVEDLLRQQLELMACDPRASGLAVITALRRGEVVREIVDYAAKVRADVVVFATPEHGRLHRVISAHVVGRVLRRSPCPVLTVRPAALQAHAF